MNDAGPSAAGRLGDLLGQSSLASFQAGYVGRKWLHADAPDAARFGRLASLAELERLLFAAGGSTEVVQVVGGSALGPGGSAAAACAAHSALDRWAEGATLVFTGIDRRLPAIAALARELEGELKCRVWCNLYLTPAGGRGFESHYDSHDVIVLQLFGSKRWRLGPIAVEAPMPFQTHNRVAMGDADQPAELQLRMGDALYIPRGMAHEAFAETDLSAHLTVGIYARTVLDVILTAVTLAADADPRFRESVPYGAFEIGPEVVDMARALMATVADAQFAEVGSAFCELLGSERTPTPTGLLGLNGKADRVVESDRFRAVANLMASLTRQGEVIELHAFGAVTVHPAAQGDDLALCCSGRPFTLGELTGSSSAADRIEFIRSLLFAGVIERLRDGDDCSTVAVNLVDHLDEITR